jgi:hypothetical protein
MYIQNFDTPNSIFDYARLLTPNITNPLDLKFLNFTLIFAKKKSEEWHDFLSAQLFFVLTKFDKNDIFRKFIKNMAKKS